MNNETQNLKEEITDSYSCPNCGGKMNYNPTDKNMKCDYCGTVEEIYLEKEECQINEYSIEEAEEQANMDWDQELRVMKCENCGAEINVEINTQALFCPFCGSSHVIKEDEKNGRIKPETLVPFLIDKKTAEEKFKEWIKKTKFAPRGLKKQAQSDKIQGVYIPYWTYDSDTTTIYKAKRGDYYYETKTVTDENGNSKVKKERKIRWRIVNGDLSQYYDDVIIPGSKKHLGNLLDRVDNYDLNSLVEYNPKFLSGFMAERYSINLKEGWLEAQKIIEENIQDSITKEVGGDKCIILDKKINHGNVLYKHFLVPAWLSSYEYKGKIYQYVINGQNGELEGEYPMSGLKIFLAIFIPIFVIYVVYKLCS